jgi:hypothetical protein
MSDLFRHIFKLEIVRCMKNKIDTPHGNYKLPKGRDVKHCFNLFSFKPKCLQCSYITANTLKNNLL